MRLPNFVPDKLVIAAAFLLFIITASCTSTRWAVKEKRAVDPEDYELASSTAQLVHKGTVSPDNPILKLALQQKNTYRYKEKLLYKRLIQEYRPRWTYTAISILSAGVIFYASHSDRLLHSIDQNQKLALNALGGIVALSPLLTMKPIGTAIETGETDYGRVTGSKQITRTEQNSGDRIEQLSYSLLYNADTLVKRQIRNINDSLVRFNLVEMVDPQRFRNARSDSLQLKIAFRDQHYSYEIGLSKFLLPFARVDKEFATLRNAPDEEESGILTDLARGSMLRLVGVVRDNWYRVKFGLKDTYINREAVELVWRPGTFEQKESIVKLDKIPFGDIDVESNVPVLQTNNSNGLGFLAAVENYRGLDSRTYALRDARLIELYMSESLGFEASRIFRSNNLDSLQKIERNINKLRQKTSADSSNIVLYLSGQAVARDNPEGYRYYLIPSGVEYSDTTDASKLLDLQRFFSRLSELDSYQTIVIADLSFNTDDPFLDKPENLQIIRPLASIARQLTENHTRSAVIFSSQFNQSSHLFYKQGQVDKKHRIFPYFFARALQERMTNLKDIMNFLERNVNYTARKYHETGQDPQFYGNDNLSLILDSSEAGY